MSIEKEIAELRKQREEISKKINELKDLQELQNNHIRIKRYYSSNSPEWDGYDVEIRGKKNEKFKPIGRRYKSIKELKEFLHEFTLAIEDMESKVSKLEEME